MSYSFEIPDPIEFKSISDTTRVKITEMQPDRVCYTIRSRISPTAEWMKPNQYSCSDLRYLIERLDCLMPLRDWDEDSRILMMNLLYGQDRLHLYKVGDRIISLLSGMLGEVTKFMGFTSGQPHYRCQLDDGTTLDWVEEATIELEETYLACGSEFLLSCPICEPKATQLSQGEASSS